MDKKVSSLHNETYKSVYKCTKQEDKVTNFYGDFSVWFVFLGLFFWEFLMSCSPYCFRIGLLYHHDTCSMIPDIMIYFRSRKNLPLSSLCLGKIAFNPMGALQTARTCLGANVFCCLLITNECLCHGEPCVYWFNAGLQWMLWP